MNAEKGSESLLEEKKNQDQTTGSSMINLSSMVCAIIGQNDPSVFEYEER
jgi:hypothetical protein